MVGMVKAGNLPLWNPYLFCGYSFLATLQVGFFYPLTILLYILPFHLAFNYYTILHYFLGALFMYYLMRHFALSRASSFLSGVVFAFSGYLISMANMNTTLTSVIWLPLILLFYDKSIRMEKGISGRYMLILGVLFALQFLGGEPTVIYVSTLFLLIYGIIESRSFKAGFRNLGVLALSLLLSAFLCAIQLFPLAEVSRLSLRFFRTEYGFIASKSFPPRELINFIIPFGFGNLIKGSYARILMGDQHQPWLLSTYFGVLPILFAFFSFLGFRRKTIFFWGMMLFSLFLAFGRFTPVYGFFFRFLPGIGLIRYPVKYLFLAVFSLSVLCGFGYEKVQEIIGGNKRGLEKLLAILGLLFMVAGAVYLWANANQTRIFLYFRNFYAPDLYPYFVGLLYRIINSDIRSLGNLVIILFAGLSLFYLNYKGIIKKGILNFFIVSLILIDLAGSNIGINPPGPYQIFEQSTPNIEILQKDKEKIYRYFFLPPMRDEKRLIFETWNENLYHIKDNLTPNWMAPYQIACLRGRESIEPREVLLFFLPFIWDLPEKYGELLDMTNVKYIFALKPLKDPKLLLLRAKKIGEGTGYLYKNLDCLPRAYFVKSAKVIMDRDKIIEEIGRNRFDPKEKVMLEEEIDYEWQPSRKAERVEIVKYGPNQVMIDTFSEQSRILFMSDAFYPGWKAFVDGNKAKIYRANYAFRAVHLDPGRHKVEFIYDPLSFKLGGAISLVSLVFLIGFSLYYRKRDAIK